MSKKERSFEEIKIELFNSAEKTKSFSKRLNFIGILGLIIGLSSHRYLLKDMNIDLCFSGFAAIIMISNILVSYFFGSMVTAGIEILDRKLSGIDNED